MGKATAMVILLIATAWTTVLVVVLALCRAAARGDAVAAVTSRDRRRYTNLPPASPRTGPALGRALALRDSRSFARPLS
jgi:hypothetical protein